MRLLGAFLLLAGCFHGGKPATTTTGVGSAAVAPTGIVIADASIGPIDAGTPATLDGLRGKLAGYEVKATRDEHDALQYDAYKDGVLVFSVADDNGKVLNVITSDPKVTVSNHPTWHAGALFSEAKTLSRCACWGAKYTCWKDGEHVAASFERSCTKPEDDVHVLVVLDGSPIEHLVWSPTPFGYDDEDSGSTQPPSVIPNPDPCGGNPCGGNPCGGNPCGP